jgi:hypothetical protein
MPTTDPNRSFVRVDFRFVLAGPAIGGLEPRGKAWFFDVPPARDSAEHWRELMHRIFYDYNVRMRRREPGDVNWLTVVDLAASPVDTAAVVASGGKTWDAVPWFAADRAKVFEDGACYIVDDDGRYDSLGASDYTELMLNRLAQRGAIDVATFVGFFDQLYQLAGRPAGAGRTLWDKRAERFANCVALRPHVALQKEPGKQPWASGPVDPADL